MEGSLPVLRRGGRHEKRTRDPRLSIQSTLYLHGLTWLYMALYLVSNYELAHWRGEIWEFFNEVGKFAPGKEVGDWAD